jgi:hypothetical protein
VPVLGTITPIEFAHDEWTLLVKAWRGLNPDQKEQRIRAHIERLRAEGRLPDWPTLPGIDDILRLPARERNRTLTELKEDRKNRIIRIQQSATPPELRALGSVVNALDDAEDLLSFFSVIGRLAIRAAPRVLGRFVPILGWALTASDILNVLVAIMQGAAVAKGFELHGLTGAAAQAAGPYAVKAVFKNELWEMLRIGRRKFVRAIGINTPVKQLISRGDILESLQATDTLWGVGISLGAIVGYFQDLAWSLQRGVFGPVPREQTDLATEFKKDIVPEYVIVGPTPNLGSHP